MKSGGSAQKTAPWHFVDIPPSAATYDAARDCPRDNCVVAQFERGARIVGDRQLAAPVRAEALRFLIHFVGDIEQPLDECQQRASQSVLCLCVHPSYDSAVAAILSRDSVQVIRCLQTAPSRPTGS